MLDNLASGQPLWHLRRELVDNYGECYNSCVQTGRHRGDN